MPKPTKDGECQCNYLEDLADDPMAPVEFDAKLNEYHIMRKDNGHFMIYYYPFCGGRAPKSKRNRLFHKLAEAELQRLINLTKHLKTLEQVIGTFGRPKLDQPTGLIQVIPEREGKPETTQSFRVLIYEKLSKTADVHVTVYPDERVGIGYQGKAKKTH